MRSGKYIFILLLTIIAVQVTAQTFRFTRYGEDEGLPAPLVKSVTRDDRGVLWAATDDGLIRYDGRDFKLFRNELPGPYAKSIISTGKNKLLLTSDMGISEITDINGIVNIETIAAGTVYQTDTAMWFPKVFYRDFLGRLWVSDNVRVYQYINGKFKFYPMGEGVITNNYNRSFSFADDGQNNFFAFSETGLIFRLNEKTGSFESIPVPVRFSGIHSAYLFKKGRILIAAREGLFEMRISTNGTPATVSKISSLEISHLAGNSKGYVFAGTWSSGLYLLAEENGSIRTIPVNEYPEKDVAFIFADQDDDVWLASDAGIILMQETLFGNPYSRLSENYIQSINTDAPGNVYFTDGNSISLVPVEAGQDARKLFATTSFVLQVLPVDNGFWLSDTDGNITFVNQEGKERNKFNFSQFGKAIFKMVMTPDGSIWACQDANDAIIRISPDKNIRLYGRSNGLTSRTISLQVSRSGQLFAGGMLDSAYLFIYHSAGDKFVNLSEKVEFRRNIDINVNDLVIEPGNNIIWLGTSFGLIRAEAGRFERVDLGVLTDNSVKALAFDSLGYLWFANNKGLHRYKDGDVVSFDQRSGLPSKTIAYRGIMVDKSNRLWVGTLAGTAVSRALGHPRKTLTPAIQMLLVNNQNYELETTKAINISNKGFLSLKIASSEYPARQILYQRWIEGIDSAWVNLSSEGAIILANLKPGDYKVKVRARRSGNYSFSDPLVVQVSVERVWYERWWMLLLFFFTLFFILRAGLLRHSRKLRTDNEKLEHIVAERTREMVRQRDQIEEQNLRIIQKNEALNLKYAELELAKNQAEEAARAKTQFLSVISHEIRTPLNAVIGITHLLMKENPRTDQLEDLKILKFSAESLLTLINDVLDLNKIEAGKLLIENIDFNLRNLAEGVRTSMMHEANSKGILIKLQYSENLPLFVKSDPLRLSQVLNNLVSNAVKFTEKGGVLIDISLKSEYDDSLEVEFNVSDSGIGIPEEMHRNIFEAFTQASGDTTRKFGGTGLGLAITHRLLQMMGSEIKLVSSPGEGSSFSFVLNMQKSPKMLAEQAENEPDSESYKFDNQRILLVEDNKINAIIARKFIEEWNLEVIIANSGADALEKLRTHGFDLVLMDLQMPDMDGYETTREIRNLDHSHIKDIPVIALSATSKQDVLERLNTSGIDDFVSKPFNPDELLGKLKKYLLKAD